MCSELLLASHPCSENKQKIICSSRVCPWKIEKVWLSLSNIAASMGALNGCVENFSALAILQEAALVSLGNKMSRQQSPCATP